MFFSFSLTMSPNLTAQDFNLDLVSNPSDGGCSNYNDVWGFRHSNGIEYAILGSNCGIVIYQLSGGGAATKIKSIAGVTSIWRDIKNYGDFVYVVTDQGQTFDGLMVVDMTTPTNSGITSSLYKPTIADMGAPNGSLQLDRAHNLYIDEDGYIYLAGASGSPAGNGVGQQSINGGGILILDADQDPSNPPLVGMGPSIYAHDVFVRNDMMFTSEIYLGQFSIYSLTKTSLGVSYSAQGAKTTEKLFTHNAWTNDDNSIVLTTDEKTGAAIEAFDISNPGSITKVGSYLPAGTADGDEIPHNVHVQGNFAIVSHYSEGVKVINISDPSNLVEVGAYDTNAGTSGFAGCWGAYPFLPSGLVLASDRDNGLFVFNPNYVAANYLKGKITNVAGDEVEDATITLIASPFDTEGLSNVDGDYKMGIVDQNSLPGNSSRSASNTVTVSVSAAGYQSQAIDVNLLPGQEVIQDFVLEEFALPVEILSFTGVADNCAHHLKWQVGSTLGHSHFELQVSANGNDFQTVRQLMPEDQTNFDQYEVTLTNELRDESFYRLMQVDLDGQTEFSKIVHISGACSDQFNGIRLFPNPTADWIKVEAGQSEIQSLEIYLHNGLLLKEKTVEAGNTTLSYSVAQLPSGVYFVAILTDQGRIVQKLFKE